MARRRTRRSASPARKPKDHVVVTNRSYGKALKGTKIYFEGRRPSSLKLDGRINFGKTILEALKERFSRFRWIITEEGDSISTERGIVRVRTSQRLLSRMSSENINRSRDIKVDIIERFFSIHFPDHFKERTAPTYVPGSLSRILSPEIVPRLSGQDKEALNTFLPPYVASESVGSVNTLKATAQIQTLKGLADDLSREVSREHTESWWHAYVKANILLMQQGYIKAIEKLNLSVGETKFPDFLLVTHDNYLDILEIKKPNTPMLREDSSRGNVFFESELSKAIIQVENYIANVMKHADSLRTHLKDKHGIEIRAVRPRGIILAGDTRLCASVKQQDDFRLLSQGIKNVTLLTYDELLTRLQNYIAVLEEFSRPVPRLELRCGPAQ